MDNVRLSSMEDLYERVGRKLNYLSKVEKYTNKVSSRVERDKK